MRRLVLALCAVGLLASAAPVAAWWQPPSHVALGGGSGWDRTVVPGLETSDIELAHEAGCLDDLVYDRFCYFSTWHWNRW